MSEGGFPLFGGDPEDLLRGLREFAEQQAESVQDAQREQFATLTLSTAVELTAAALKQVQATGSVDEQAIALRDAMRVLFPEAVALKRQCIIHGKPFLSTLASAREWLELEACALGAAPDATLDATFDLANEGIALIAHDAMKGKMLELAERHFDLLDSFASRCATGTTGGLLNKLAQKIKGEEAGRNWVRPFLSGPLGGDAQIAELILDRQCRRVLFLEDPHVARQHEADIQLLDRATRTVPDYASCMSDLQCVDRWLGLLAQRVNIKAGTKNP